MRGVVIVNEKIYKQVENLGFFPKPYWKTTKI